MSDADFLAYAAAQINRAADEMRADNDAAERRADDDARNWRSELEAEEHAAA